ncbi:MAG: ATP-binding protein [Clostridiales bacterium]|jgi:anti-sigma regulatory factor (Ser/Thr protein kinase)|nr:ATP-binding protein [Clostridiales bacterium]
MASCIFTKGLEQMDEVLEMVEEAMSSTGFSGKAKSQVLLATEEVYCNIANYAYESGDCRVQISCEISKNPLSIAIEFMDSGTPFNPLQVSEPDVLAEIQEREAGGLGIFLVRKIMDDVNYDYRDGNNILIIKKRA